MKKIIVFLMAFSFAASFTFADITDLKKIRTKKGSGKLIQDARSANTVNEIKQVLIDFIKPETAED